MRRTLCLLATALVAGCGTVTEVPVPPAERARPQHAELGWREVYPSGRERLVFEVRELDVREDGWSADVAVTNQTGIGFETGGPADRLYGLMLFADGDLEELQRASRTGTLPAVRRAVSIEPPPPALLRPGATWRATLAAPGALAAGSWVRVAFGPFTAAGDAPEGMEPVVYWITDRTRRL